MSDRPRNRRRMAADPSLRERRADAPSPRSRSSRRRRGPFIPPLLVFVALFVAAGAFIWAIAPKSDASKVAGSKLWERAAKAAVITQDEPTPYFATFRKERLRLPVQATDVTVLAFHQTSYNDSLPMKSLVPKGDKEALAQEIERAKAAKKDGTLVEAAVAEADAPAADEGGVWTGTALHLWRTGRAGKQDTAIDCGAKPGTMVYAPVSGIVMQVRPYKLYKKHDDYEIHIKPDAWSDVDFIILHVSDPVCRPGQQVEAGVTPLAKVRKLSSVVSGLQLRKYSLDGGNHCHLQINRIPRPNERWIVGQDPPGFKRRD